MNEQDYWSKFFTKSSFFSLKKEEELSPELIILQSKIILNETISNFHPKRKDEYVLGRMCASKAFENCLGLELLSLPSHKDRSPIWPIEVVGSIAHDKNYVGAAVAKKSDLIGLGIDFEEMGRTKMELSSHIRSNEDLKYHVDFSEEELLTLIFSTKESLYKALYPLVQKFFGFEDAALRSINLDTGIFQIDLLTQLSLNFGPNSLHSFQGRFTVKNKTCLTVLEIAP